VTLVAAAMAAKNTMARTVPPIFKSMTWRRNIFEDKAFEKQVRPRLELRFRYLRCLSLVGKLTRENLGGSIIQAEYCQEG
jgi:hypothetical protein